MMCLEYTCRYMYLTVQRGVDLHDRVIWQGRTDGSLQVLACSSTCREARMIALVFSFLEVSFHMFSFHVVCVNICVPVVTPSKRLITNCENHVVKSILFMQCMLRSFAVCYMYMYTCSYSLRTGPNIVATCPDKVTLLREPLLKYFSQPFKIHIPVGTSIV